MGIDNVEFLYPPPYPEVGRWLKRQLKPIVEEELAMANHIIPLSNEAMAPSWKREVLTMAKDQPEFKQGSAAREKALQREIKASDAKIAEDQAKKDEE
jgi:tellurite resistance protein